MTRTISVSTTARETNARHQEARRGPMRVAVGISVTPTGSAADIILDHWTKSLYTILPAGYFDMPEYEITELPTVADLFRTADLAGEFTDHFELDD